KNSSSHPKSSNQKKKKPMTRWFLLRVLQEFQRRAYTNTLQIVSHNVNRRIIAKLFLQGYNHADNQAPQRYN
ncbi:hypothetical protein ACQP3C_30770, partial [Escherichia coli]